MDLTQRGGVCLCTDHPHVQAPPASASPAHKPFPVCAPSWEFAYTPLSPFYHLPSSQFSKLFADLGSLCQPLSLSAGLGPPQWIFPLLEKGTDPSLSRC